MPAEAGPPTRDPQPPRKKFIWPGGWWRSLFSILAGNAIYFGIENDLPARMQHTPGAFDWGLALDLWICAAIYGLSRLVWPVR